MKMKLTVTLQDGRELAGNYDWLGVMARLSYMRSLPTFKDFTITEAA